MYRNCPLQDCSLASLAFLKPVYVYTRLTRQIVQWILERFSTLQGTRPWWYKSYFLFTLLIASERNAIREWSRRRKIKSESEMYWFFGLTRYCNSARWLLIAFLALRSHKKNPACNKAPRKRFVSVKQTGQNYVGYSLCLSCKPQEPFTVGKISKWLHRNSRLVISITPCVANMKMISGEIWKWLKNVRPDWRFFLRFFVGHFLHFKVW